MQKPLSVIIQETRLQIVRSINEAVHQAGLPSYLAEIILLSALADIREGKCAELVADYNRYMEGMEAEKADRKPEETVSTEA